MDAALSKRKGSKRGIGISSIFDTVFRYLSIFLAVLRYWVPCECSLLAEKLRNGFEHCGSEFGEIMAWIGGFRYPY